MNLKLIDRIEQALDEIRPSLEMDGGSVDLLEVTPKKIVRLSMLGACRGCPLSPMTLKLGIERLLFERVPEIAGILAEGVVEPGWA